MPYTPPASPQMNKKKQIPPSHFYKTKHGHVFKEVIKEIKNDIQTSARNLVKSLSGRNVWDTAAAEAKEEDDGQRRSSF